MGKSLLVIGGGIVGLCAALRLQRTGFETTICDPGDPAGAASWGNAGHIAVEQVEPLASARLIASVPQRLFVRGGALDMPLRAMSQWLPFAGRLLSASRPSRFEAGKMALGGLLADAMPAWHRLVDEIDAPGLLREDGHFVVWETPTTAANGIAAWSRTAIGGASFAQTTAEEIHRISGLTSSPIADAIRFAGSGQVADLPRLRASLCSALDAAGGKRISKRVSGIDSGVVRFEDGALLRPDILLMTAGVRSAALLRGLEFAPMIAERGYHIEAAAAWPKDMPPVVFEDRSMIVTGFESGLRAASFVELNHADAPPDVRKWERLEAHVAALGLPFEPPFRRWMGSRPTLPDYLPAIGRSRSLPNLYYAFGHQHLGLTLGPLTGELVGGMIAEGQVPDRLAPFDLARFR